MLVSDTRKPYGIAVGVENTGEKLLGETKTFAALRIPTKSAACTD